jgi:hypothetical protein
MVLGLEERIGLVNCTEHPEVGILEKLDADVRHAVDVWSRQDPPMSPVLSATFLVKDEDYCQC